MNNNYKIPKIIHYCWLGGKPMPDSVRKYIDTWSEFCPDYELILWDEKRFDINSYDYTKEAYEEGKFAFVSDVIRLHALKEMGGIYLDSDVEILKPIDDLLCEEMIWGYESEGKVSTAFIGSIRNHAFINSLLEEYSSIHFKREDGSLNMMTNVERISKKIAEENNIKIYPQEYLSPKDYFTDEIKITSNTYAIHHFSTSWKSEEEKYKERFIKKYENKMPKKLCWYLAAYISVMKYRGILQGHKDMFKLFTKNAQKYR